MQFKRVLSVYFSATGTTKKVVTTIAENLSKSLGLKCETFDFTLAKMRTTEVRIEKEDIVVFGTPVYAGRVPNILLKYLSTINGNGAIAVPIVVFGNRDYDDALIELRDMLEKDNFKTIAAASFIGEHSFSNILAKDRPDSKDYEISVDFSNKIVKKIKSLNYYDLDDPIPVKGTDYPYRGYYQPRDRYGNSINILKFKPLTNDNCNDCKLCVSVCPMNSISFDDVRMFTGICIKCGACIKKCLQNARYYNDEGYLYHKQELEDMYERRAEPEIFI
jgi:NAD-dependent dihydropyrimidine dehydrogenase PreA subunit/flavodoxin